jgi:hypothetical protein
MIGEKTNEGNIMKMTADQKRAIKSALDKFAWPGGYPVFLVTSDGAALCPDCVRSELRSIVSAARDNDTRCGWHPAAADINWEEADLYCDHCSNRIESAYAEDKVTA